MTNILIAGVGGQGILLASVIIGRVAMALGRDVKMSELHGMAQRGGSVVSHIRLADEGEKVAAPVIDRGDADILLAFEQLEALRYADYLNPETGLAYINSAQIVPLSVMIGAVPMPDNLKEQFAAAFPRRVLVDADRLALQAGNRRAANIVLLGALAAAADIAQSCWLQAVADSVRTEYRDSNVQAFLLGFEAGGER